MPGRLEQEKIVMRNKLLTREPSRTEDAELKAMFDSAWDVLGADEREEIRREREVWMAARAGSSVKSGHETPL
jgi:hypothetical protein